MYLYRRARLVSKLLKLNEADGDWRITLMNIFYVRSMLFAGHLSRIIIIMKCFPNVFNSSNAAQSLQKVAKFSSNVSYLGLFTWHYDILLHLKIIKLACVREPDS